MWPCRHACRCVHFYPRPPRGGRHELDNNTESVHKFLSTPSARRATSERHRVQRSNRISIHALREEGDLPFPQHTALAQYFYPRPPRGGRRLRRSARSGDPPISIHALREEGDADQISVYLSHDDFYPRPPRGGRPVHADTSTAGIYFYPRPPRGGRLCWLTSLLNTRLFLSTPSARRAT